MKRVEFELDNGTVVTFGKNSFRWETQDGKVFYLSEKELVALLETYRVQTESRRKELP